MTRGSDHNPKGYWNELHAEELERQREQEELEEILLEGRWVSAKQALKMAMVGGDTRDDAVAFIRAQATRERKQRPALRVRAKLSQAREISGSLTTRRDRIVHGYEWDGEVKEGHWGSGTFVLATRHSLGRTVTLTGTEFSLDDLEEILGTDSSEPPVSPLGTSNIRPAPAETQVGRSRGRPAGPGYAIGDIPAFERMRILIKEGKQKTTAAKIADRELNPGKATSAWERYRKTYDAWLKSMGD